MKARGNLDERLLTTFVIESNYIEGIKGARAAEVEAHMDFLDRPLEIMSIVELVSVLQPDARLRNQPHIPGVQVGGHVAPPSGPDIQGNLLSILEIEDPWEQHVAYETLHPFTDGNGRSGRAIWLYRHFHNLLIDPYAIQRGFLHSWYYHTLANARR